MLISPSPNGESSRDGRHASLKVLVDLFRRRLCPRGIAGHHAAGAAGPLRRLRVKRVGDAECRARPRAPPQLIGSFAQLGSFAVMLLWLIAGYVSVLAPRSIIAALFAADPARERRGTNLGHLHGATERIRPTTAPRAHSDRSGACARHQQEARTRCRARRNALGRVERRRPQHHGGATGGHRATSSAWSIW